MIHTVMLCTYLSLINLFIYLWIMWWPGGGGGLELTSPALLASFHILCSCIKMYTSIYIWYIF